MTDLKGDFLTRLLTKKERNAYFTFLERGNWLIFQDAYPQFLLYSESLKRGKPLFYLLPYLDISTFMETIWNYFWKKSDPYILTIALVINEQNYLEKRIIQNPIYQKDVLGTLEFKLQDVLSFNHILFPYRKKNLAGQTLHQFQSLHERIVLGKRLYAVLFQNKDSIRKMGKRTPSYRIEKGLLAASIQQCERRNTWNSISAPLKLLQAEMGSEKNL